MCGLLNYSGCVDCWILGVWIAELFWVCGLLDTGCVDG